MLKKISLLTMLLTFVVSAQAQFKFGVHAAPLISLMGTESDYVDNAGVNLGLGVGVELEYYIGDSENYAITFGIDFSINKGGSLLYRYGGTFMPVSSLNGDVFVNSAGQAYPDRTGIDMAAFTKINYSINYLELPIGLKLRTNELGGSYMRAFFHLPLVKIGVPISASGQIFTPDSGTDGYVEDLIGYKVKADGSPYKARNIWKDVTPIQISLGAGAGVEYSPNEDGGLRIYAGLYYDVGLIDITNGFTGDQVKLRKPNQVAYTAAENPNNMLHNIALRVGANF